MEMKKYWYAAQKDSDDEWGNGSYDLEEAKAMARDYRARGYAEALVAVIDEENSVCIDEIRDLMEKKYRIKLEYWDLWGVNDEDMSIIDMDEIKRLSIEWEKPIEELMEQVEEYTPIMDYIHPIEKS